MTSKKSKQKGIFFILPLIIIAGLIFFKYDFIYNKIMYIVHSKKSKNAPAILNIYHESILEEPSGLTIDTHNRVLWTVCDKNINAVKMDYNGTIIHHFPIGIGQSVADVEGIHYDPKSKRLYIAFENHSTGYNHGTIV